MKIEINGQFEYINLTTKGVHIFKVKDEIMENIIEKRDKYGNIGIFVYFGILTLEFFVYIKTRKFLFEFIIVSITLFFVIAAVAELFERNYKKSILLRPNSEITKFDYWLSLDGAYDKNINYANGDDIIDRFCIAITTEKLRERHISKLNNLKKEGADIEYMRPATFEDYEMVNDLALVVGISKSKRIYPIFSFEDSYTGINIYYFKIIEKIKKFYGMNFEDKYDLVTDYGYLSMHYFEYPFSDLSIYIRKVTVRYIYLWDPIMSKWEKIEMLDEEYEELGLK